MFEFYNSDGAKSIVNFNNVTFASKSFKKIIGDKYIVTLYFHFGKDHTKSFDVTEDEANRVWERVRDVFHWPLEEQTKEEDEENESY